jgi:hypothetical protein
MIYGIATGHDVAIESLTAFDPQPATVGLLYARRQYAASGEIIDELPYWEYRWDVLEIDEYQAILTLSGLVTAKTALVSANGPDDNYDEAIRNGRAVKPQIGSDGQRDGTFLRNFAMIIKSLQAQA